MSEYKYRDKNHPPVPRLKVGDRCYTHWPYGGRDYYYVSTCEVRKVEVLWYEPSDYDKEHMGACGYWHIDYFIRTDVDKPHMKSTKMFAYHTDEDGGSIQSLWFTPQDVMDDNIRDFKDMVNKTIANIRRTMKQLGYTVEQTKKLLEFNDFEQKQIEK